MNLQLKGIDTLFMATKPAYAQGAQVEHSKFGLGSVVSCTEEYIVIKFDEHGDWHYFGFFWRAPALLFGARFEGLADRYWYRPNR